MGFSELTIAALLGHASRGVAQRYIHIDEARLMTADRVAGEIADLLDGKAPPLRIRVGQIERAAEPASSRARKAQSSSASPFGDSTVELTDLMRVRRYLDAERGGW